MENAKKLKRGELLFKEGDNVQTVYMIQSGKVGLMVERGSNRLEVSTLGVAQIVGESGLFSTAKHVFTGEALQECKIVEVPVDLLKQQLEKTPPGIKLLVKSLVEEVRQARQNLKMLKIESEKSPFPQGSIHRVFTALHLVARHIGKKEASGTATLISWSTFRVYCTRFFAESPQRMRHLMDLLFKLKLAEPTYAVNEEGVEDLRDVKIFELQPFEDFAEFFQYHLYKGSRAEAIYVDPLALKVAKAMYEISAVAEVDHKGGSKLEYSTLLTECKAKHGIDLKNIHLDALERKGLFVKRQSHDDGRLTLTFDRAEFGKMSFFWSILLEIDKWNEKGFVDLNEKELTVANAAGACPACKTEVAIDNKFCPNCGSKLAAA